MEDKDGKDPGSQLAMVLFRYTRGWDQQELARAAGIAPSQVSVYDRGERPVPRKTLERMADAAGVPRPLLDPILRVLRSFRIAAQGRFREGKALEEILASRWTAIVRMTVDVALEAALEDETPPASPWPPCAEDREDAEGLWRSLEPYTALQREALVEEVEELRSWALCERVAAESALAAPREAQKLAELACLIAENVPGPETWSLRLQGYAWAHLAQARRAGNDLPGAEEALRRARELWDAGAPGDPGLVDESRMAQRFGWPRIQAHRS
ncbi:MAG TPA: helix-turn-helix domain-containing protein [Thermoanaerobaculia bacterium]|nr:helix-turn-helix domain-containing protein [Thermoanaerobaculia bacterium]